MGAIRSLLALLVLLAGALVLLGSLAPTPSAPARPAARAEAGGDPAIERYRSGDYAGAEDLWRARLTEAPGAAERADLCYDLGNACYRQARFLEAVAWYESALRLAPRDALAWRNLELARAKAEIEPADRGDLAGSFARLARWLTVGEWRALAVGLSAALALALALEILRGGALLKALAACLAVGAAACVAVLGWRAAGELRAPALVIERAGATLASEPRAGAPPVGRAEAGSVVEVVDRYLDWARVEGADGVAGWVGADAVQALDA